MSEATMIRLVICQREREMRADRRWEVFDLVALPLAGVLATGFAAVLILYVLACGAINCLCNTNVLTDAAGSPHGHL